MKVFVAGLMHETNSFSPIATTRESFSDTCLVRPSALPAGAPSLVLLETYPAYGAFLREGERRGDTIICGPAAFAMPSAPAPAHLYAELKAAILTDLAAALPVHAVLLMLHGAQVAEGCDDCAGDLVTAIRDLAGSAVIGVELDLHGFCSDRLIQASDICLACKEYPHDDFDDRARHLYGLVARAVAREIAPVQVRRRVPMLAMHHPTRQPMRGLVDYTNRIERDGQALAVSLLHGFPWADVPDCGAAVIVVCDRDRDAAEALAGRLADAFFAQRDEVMQRIAGLDETLTRAAAAVPPVVVADGSDNPGGGCASDSTFLLHAIRERGVKGAGVAIVWDPAAVAAAHAAGLGADYRGSVGGRHGPCSGTPFEGMIRVIALADDVRQGGFFERAGAAQGAAALDVDGIVVIVSGRRQQCVSPEAFTQFGIDPASLDLIVVKSSQHFHAGFAAVAGTILHCNAPGALSQDFASLPYRRIERPLWPLDTIDRLAS